ncbi:hypothetical protein Daudx_0795 [Candidatus Desulforudis audaxviator]|nr:hypothetical protein Daudx_0795 [Candidatus Desulforudis audaxviator]
MEHRSNFQIRQREAKRPLLDPYRKAYPCLENAEIDSLPLYLTVKSC